MRLEIKDDWGFDRHVMSDCVVVTDDPVQDKYDAERREFNLTVLKEKLAQYDAMDPSRSLKLRKRIYRIQRAIDMLCAQLAVWNTHVE